MPKRNPGRSRTIKKGRTKSGNRRKNYTLRRKEISNLDKRVKAAERVIRENRERMKTSGLGLGDSISLCCRGRTCKGKRPKSLCKRVTNHAMGLGNLLTYVARSYPGYEGRGDAQLVATNTSDTHVVGKSRQGFGLSPTRSRRRRKGKSPKKGGRRKRTRKKRGRGTPKKRKRGKEEKPTPVKIPKGNDGTRLRPPKNTGNSSPAGVVDVTQAYENPDEFWWS